MDIVKLSEYLPEAVTCSLCLNVFIDPVTLSCGHSYCSPCIQKSSDHARGIFHCPQCQQSFANVSLKLNKQLGNVSWLIKQLQEKGVLEKGKRGLCEAHQERVKLFCQDDHALLCSECERSQAHANHMLTSVEDADQKFKREINVLLELLKLQKAHIRDSFSDAEKEKENLQEIMDRGGQRIGSEYKELCEAVKRMQQEQLTLARSIGKEMEQELSNMVKKYSQIKSLMREMERKCVEPAYDFLKGIRAVMVRCREALTQPLEEGLPAFKEKMWDLSLRSLFIYNTLKRCSEALPLESIVQRANVTLDRMTAHPHLLLSSSKKIVTHEAELSSPVAGRRAFDTASCVLAEEGFASGKHCWQVEVTSAGHGWALGVMKESVGRKGPVALSEESGVWALLPEQLPPAGRKAGTIRFRLYLDYEGGSLHFFEVASREPVALRSPAMFLGERVFPFFMLWQPNTQMHLVP